VRHAISLDGDHDPVKTGEKQKQRFSKGGIACHVDDRLYNNPIKIGLIEMDNGLDRCPQK
jgi:hypothetical protein